MKSYLPLLIATILWANLSILTPFAHGEEEKPPFDEVFKKMDAEVRVALKKDRTEGLKELERVGNLLSKDYPEEHMPYAMLNAVARMTSDQEKSLKILKRLAALDDSNPQIGRIVSQAKGELKNEGSPRQTA